MIRKLVLSATLLVATCVAQAGPVLSEGFDDISTLGGSGWSLTNNSTAGGSTGWFQGNTGVFDADSGAADSYIAANFLNAGLGGNISNWLISPVITLSEVTKLTFATRSGGFYNDTLEVRFSVNGASGNVGGTDASVGDFSNLALVINPFSDSSYPTDWTPYSLYFAGTGSGVLGRIAFRYVVSDTFANGDYIGIDSVDVSVPEPSMVALIAIALFAMVLVMRRRVREQAR